MQPVKPLIEKYCPNIHSIIGENPKYWDKVQYKFGEKLDNLNVGDQTESSIVLLAGRAELGESNVIHFLKYIDESIEELNQILDGPLKASYTKMIKNFVQEFDKQLLEKPNPNFLNWFAEILSLTTLIRTGEYQLVGFEVKLANGKQMDFQLKSKTSQISYVDVVSVHVPLEKASTSDLLKLTIDSKLQAKLEYKTKDLDNNEGLFILPIIWYDSKIQEQILTYVNQTDFNSMKCTPPCTLLKIEGKYQFGTIIKFIE